MGKSRMPLRITLMGFLIAAEAAHANAYRLQYGGRLTQTNGQPQQGTTTLIAGFYHAATGGSIVGSQQFNAVTLSEGIFNITIELTPAELHTIFSGSEVWIEITDLPSGKIFPRQRFAAVPYALKIPVDGSTIGYNNNGQLQLKGVAGQPLPSGSPADGQILKWRSGTGWEWGNDDGGTASGSIDSAAIQDASISNADIAASAAIAGTKISPNFGSQNIVTTGTISGNGSGLTNLPAGPLGSSIDSSEVIDGTLVDADISATAAIDPGKINGLTAALAGKESLITAGTGAQYLRGDKSWATLDTSAIPENSNLYFTDARARAAISAAAPLVYDSSSGAISLPAATSVADGYLSSSDWLTFSGKQAAITAASTVNAGSLSTALQNGLSMKPFGTTAGEAGELRFVEVTGSGSNYIGFKAPDSVGINKIWTLPAIDGISGQVLTTNGSGVLLWTTGGGGGGGASGTVTDITAGTGLTGGTITASGIIDLADTAVTAGSYTRANITVDAQGRLTAAANGGAVNLGTEVTGTLPLTNGGTGATTAGAARTNLGLGSLATASAISSSEITDGTIVDADISGSAAIAQSKVNGLTTALAGKEPAITAGTAAQFFRGDKTWATLDTAAVPENTNLYFTDARARAAISGTAPVSYNNTTGAISMAAATSVANGYLSSGDWLTFNNKQAEITAASTVNSGTLTSASQNGMQLKPFGSTAGEAGELRFTEVTGAGSNHVGFKAPDSITADKIWTLPAADGTSGQILSTNGSGVLAWTSGNAGTVTSITAGTGLSGGTISGSGTINLANTAVTAGSYTRANITVDAQGRLTAAVNGGNVNLASEVSGTLPVANGGTGLTAGTSGGIPYYSSTSAMTSSAALTANGVLLGGGAGAAPTATAAGTANQTLRIPSGGGAPAFGALDISQSAAVTGVLAIANGGTGSSTTLNNNRIMVSSSSQIREAAALTNGQLLIGSTGSAPVGAALAQGSNAGVTITNGAGSITLDTAQDIRTTATPTFAGVALGSGALKASSLVAGTGDATTTPVGGTVRSASVSGVANTVGPNLTITPGNGTGTGGSGSILFQTAPAGTTGSTANTMATRMTIDKAGNVGVGTANPVSQLHLHSSSTATDARIMITDATTGATNTSGFGLIKGSDEQGFVWNYYNAGIRFGTASAERMVITNAGNVGIGTTSPSQKLSVSGGPLAQADYTDGDKFLLMGKTNSAKISHGGGWSFDSYAGSLVSDGGSGSSGDFSWSTVNSAGTGFTERMRLSNSGYLNLKTSNYPAMVIEGAHTDMAFYINNTSGSGHMWGIFAGGTGSAVPGGLRFWDNTLLTDRMVIDSSGNVGIGTTSPAVALDVAGKISLYDGTKTLNGGLATEANATVINFGMNEDSFSRFGGTYSSASQGGLFRVDTRNIYPLFQFQGRQGGSTAAMSPLMSITAAGNVGIGTTSPAAPLHVLAPGATIGANLSTVFYAQNNTGMQNSINVRSKDDLTDIGADYYNTAYTTSNTNLSFSTRNNGAALSERMRITSAGNVGIGTSSPSNTLHVVGSLCVKSAAGNCAGALAGRIYATTTTLQAADLAENMPIEDETLKPGDVVTLETSSTTFKGTFAKSSEKNQANAVGVVSTAPGVVLGSEQEKSRPIALAGRVPVNVNLEGGKIAVGDYLVASSSPGQAMRAKSATDAGIIGIALTAYEGLPVAAQDYGDGIAHEAGHQVMLLVQNGAGSQSAVAGLQKRLAAVEAEAAALSKETKALKDWICSQPTKAPFCAP